VMAVIVSLTVTSAALYLTPDELEHWHYILQRLFYFPVILAGLTLGWRGGAAVALLASLVYLLRHDALDAVDWIDRYLEAMMFCLVGILTGVLSDRERRQRESLKQTAKRLKEVYAELQSNVEHLKRAARMSALGHLSAGLAHEIRNPLASIDGAAYVAQTDPDPGRSTEFLGIIRKETQRLNGLVTQFLEFARPRPPELQKADPRELTESVLSLVGQVAARSNVRLKQAFDGPVGAVRFDQEQMKQVLLNLVLNAIQAMPNGGEVTVSAEESNGMLILRVRDTGAGIAPEKVDDIFDPFYTTKQDGTGLGLPIAYQIVQQHGGELALESNSAGGCCFAIRIPLIQKTNK
jgi:two-component system sensor histidine kinase HydH